MEMCFFLGPEGGGGGEGGGGVAKPRRGCRQVARLRGEASWEVRTKSEFYASALSALASCKFDFCVSTCESFQMAKSRAANCEKERQQERKNGNLIKNENSSDSELQVSTREMGFVRLKQMPKIASFFCIFSYHSQKKLQIAANFWQCQDFESF